MKEENIISARQFSKGQRLLLVVITLIILALGILASYLLFRNYQLRRQDSKPTQVEISLR